jgi:hypothetical protein
MTIWGYVTIGYFLVGIILTYIWWHDEYEPEYELAKELNEGVEEPMAVLFLAALVFFWPFKVVKNYFESFVD